VKLVVVTKGFVPVVVLLVVLLVVLVVVLVVLVVLVVVLVVPVPVVVAQYQILLVVVLVVVVVVLVHHVECNGMLGNIFLDLDLPVLPTPFFLRKILSDIQHLELV
jgi:hypothetical protein